MDGSAFDWDVYESHGRSYEYRRYMRRFLDMAKAEKFIVNTPVAELSYGYLRFPDTKFNPEGDYKQDFLLSAEDAKKFCERVESDPRAVVKGKKAKVKFTKVDGQYKFRSKQHATVKTKSGEVFEMKPRLYYIVDGKTVEYPEDKPQPWSGSTGEIEVEIVPFDGFGGGLTMRLRAIRLHKIVEGKTGGNGNWEEVEEGYTSSSAPRPVSDDDEKELSEEDVEDESDDEEEERW